jgi:hypothetical protein
MPITSDYFATPDSSSICKFDKWAWVDRLRAGIRNKILQEKNPMRNLRDKLLQSLEVGTLPLFDIQRKARAPSFKIRSAPVPASISTSMPKYAAASLKMRPAPPLSAATHSAPESMSFWRSCLSHPARTMRTWIPARLRWHGRLAPESLQFHWLSCCSAPGVGRADSGAACARYAGFRLAALP